MKHLPSVFVLLVALAGVPAAAQSITDRMWYGGRLGASFGTVDVVEVAPLLGFDATPKLTTGLGLVYRYRNDDRFQPSFSTSDYGANVFMRYRIAAAAFLQGEYEYLDYEYQTPGGARVRDEFNSFLAGAGYSQRAGGRTRLFAMALYNFSYDSADTASPYDDPWTFRVGVGVGF